MDKTREAGSEWESPQVSRHEGVGSKGIDAQDHRYAGRNSWIEAGGNREPFFHRKQLPVTRLPGSPSGFTLRIVLSPWRIGFVAWWLATACVQAEHAPVADVDVPALLRRLVERARAVAQDTNAPVYVYKSVSMYETLDSAGAVRRAKEKIYEVTLRQGMTHNRLVAVDGRSLTDTESGVLSEKEKRWRDTYAGGRGGSVMDRMDHLVNERLMERFAYTAVGRERIRDRDCIVLDFGPRAGALPEDRLIDRVINLLRGRIWVAMDEDEIVRADVRTDGTLRLWGGMLGSLESLRLHLDRDRSPHGVWYLRHTEVTVRARRLFSLVHVRLREIGSDVRVLP